MKALTTALLAVAVLTTLPAEARRSVRPDPAAAEREMAPLRAAATDCFADTVMANPAAMRHARAGEWYAAAGVIGFLCRPEVDAMVQTHDRLFGRGTGQRYFKAAYAKHLDHALAERLQPLLERKAVASAEAPAEKTATEEPAN